MNNFTLPHTHKFFHSYDQNSNFSEPCNEVSVHFDNVNKEFTFVIKHKEQ